MIKYLLRRVPLLLLRLIYQIIIYDKRFLSNTFSDESIVAVRRGRASYIIFYVPQPRKLVFPLQLRVKQCCLFRSRGIQCRNWTAHAHYSLTAERNLFLILLLLTSSSYSVSTHYYTRPMKLKVAWTSRQFAPASYN